MKLIRTFNSQLVALVITAAFIPFLINLPNFFKIWREDKKISQATQYDYLPRIVNQVYQLTELPTDETPQLLTIADADKVGNDPFLKGVAQDGDELLIYAKAQRIILYRPSANKIVKTYP